MLDLKSPNLLDEPVHTGNWQGGWPPVALVCVHPFGVPVSLDEDESVEFAFTSTTFLLDHSRPNF